MDHVPPKSIFPPGLPSDIRMVSAPACQRCHDINKKDDTTIRNILVSTRDAEGHPAVTRGLGGKRDRSLSRSLERGGGDFEALVRTMRKVDVETPAGIYLGKDWAFNFDDPLMDRFMERLSRALLWYEFQQPYFEGTFRWRMNIDLPDLVYEGLMRFGRLRKVHDVFSYGLTAMKDDAPSWVVANFYGCTEFMIRVTKTEISNEQS
jgi:hypothetical protein